MINCIIIDDEPPAINVIKNYISQVPYLNLKGATTDPVEGLRMIREENIDLVFLDIQMPEITGLEFIKLIDGKSKIIIISAYSEFALEGFELEVIDYLLKPVPLSRFLKAVQKAKNIIEQLSAGTSPKNTADSFIILKGETKGKFIKVELSEIDYIEGAGNYVIIHTGSKKILSLVNMKELEEKLPGERFIRVHKSFIISISQIASVDGNVIILKNYPHLNHIIAGKMYKDRLMEILKQRLIG